MFLSAELKKLARSARTLIAPLFLALAGCQSQAPTDSSHETDIAVGLEREQPEWIRQVAQKKQAPRDIWERVRNGYQLQDAIGVNPRIERQRLWFASRPSFVQSASERSGPYIHYVVEQLEENNVPLELALLPIIESSYNPMAYSPAHAVGLWQFIPSTGRHFNLRQTSVYDERRDVLASTNAAIRYLTRLNTMFNGDWLLALAAYNAGEGTVSRAIERNEKLGLPTDYWNLQLPRETQDYVPKLLALSQVVLTPAAYGVSLSPIANEPYFEKVAIDRRVDLLRVAEMVDVDFDELYQLNAAYKRKVTDDSTQHLLVPTGKAELLSANLALLPEHPKVEWQQYRVRAGDSLHAIAYRHHLTVNTLKEINELRSNNLRVGQTLNIPAEAQVRPSTRTASAPAPRQYRVRQGDNLWDIARSQGVSVSQLRSWNNLQGNNLRAGQLLSLNSSSRSAPAARTSTTLYKVRQGDSLYQISRRFKVEVAHLQRWNPQASSNLRVGQTLTLHLPN